MDFYEASEPLAEMNTHDVETAVALVQADECKNPPNIATPFVKWVGGKRTLINMLIQKMPETFGNYYEPFVGGGALFFELARRGWLSKAHLSDINRDLILTYQAIKHDPTALIEKLKEHTKNHSDEYYYKVRAQHHLDDPVDIAARFIYLNKTGYNGLYRVNSKGEFNVPAGRYKNPGIVQEENIWACHQALQKAEIRCEQFDTIMPQRGDFIYLDPPYHPIDENSFTKYSHHDFTKQDQVRLRDFVIKLHNHGIKVMLSNSDTPFIKNLYSNVAFQITTVQAPRFVNCKPNQRNPVNELLITNY
jgi:DNA adenine methylase